ncbi:MAG: extracellular solute-binding protein [Deinococcota bacterium]
MKQKLLGIGLVLALLSVAFAQTEVVWWDFLSGGDGVRMKALIDEFNATHDDIQINATTLEWGVPFYTKVQTSAAVGEQPDVMTYHMSRYPLGIEQGVLRPISDDELAAAGISKDDYQPGLVEAATIDGQLYGIPFDVHSIILYYNKEILSEVGLLSEDGLPLGIDGADNFSASLQQIADAGYLPLSFGNSNEAGNVFRIFYSLLNQQAGAPPLVADGMVNASDEAKTALRTMQDWIENGYARENVDYPSSVALFTSGETAFTINGVWEVPTMIDLEASGELFDWGAVAFPVLFDQPATWVDAHTFAIPASTSNPISDEKVAAVLEVIAWMNENSISWAEAGHIPAYSPVTASVEYQELEPNATYVSLAEHSVFESRSTSTGVASPLYDAVSNFLEPALSGQISAEEAVDLFAEDLQSQMR